MDSQIIIKTETWRAKVALGLGGLVVIVILAFLYRLEVGIILLAAGGIASIRLAFWAKNQHTLGKLHARQLAAQTRAVELEADNAYWLCQQERAKANRLAMEQYIIRR